MRSQRLLPALLLLFVGSGCAALIYEVVWFQLLELVIGSSAVSIGVLLGTFMGGMCLGSLLLPRSDRPDAHPLRVYAVARARHRRRRPARAVRDAAHRRRLHRLGRHRRRRHAAARPGRRHLPAAADDADGRDAAGDRAVGRSVAAAASRGSGSSTAATPPARWSAACSPASTCCACTTSRSRPTWPSPSTSPSRPSRFADRDAVAARELARRRCAVLRAWCRAAPCVYVAIALSGLTALASEVLWTRTLSLLSARRPTPSR